MWVKVVMAETKWLGVWGRECNIVERSAWRVVPRDLSFSEGEQIKTEIHVNASIHNCRDHAHTRPALA